MQRLQIEQQRHPERTPFLARMRVLLAGVVSPWNPEPLRNTLLEEYGQDSYNYYATELAEAIRAVRPAEVSTGSLASVESHASSAGDDDEEDVLGGKGVWLSKKGEGLGLLTGSKRRYFLLRAGIQSQLLKFVYFETFKEGSLGKRKGAILLTPSSIISSSEKTLKIV